MDESVTVTGTGNFVVTRKRVHRGGAENRHQFLKNGWCFLLISLGAILRGLFYIPGVSQEKPAGLEYVIGATGPLFTVYCLAWISAGVYGIYSAFQGDRVWPISLIVALCGFWGLGYVAQLIHDLFTHSFTEPFSYLGAVTYASFGAAVLRFPAKG